LQRARDGGAVRTDVNLPDIVTLVNAIAMATETADENEAERMLSIVRAGIAEPAGPVRNRRQARKAGR